MLSSTALVLEGGGFRGVFTAGVLDVLLEHGVYGFASVWGVSAGALIGASYVSRQVGRSIRINLAYCNDRRYMSAYQLATTGNIMSTTFLYDDVQNELDPFDYATFNASPTRLYATVSDVLFGRADYIPIDRLPEKTDYLRASASLPVVSRIVRIDGGLYLDGGTTDSVPLARAFREPGVRRALVILTRERAYRKAPTPLLPAAKRLYADYPYYLEAFSTRPERYNAQRDYLWEEERAGRAFIIAPDRPVEVANMEHDGARLLDLYMQGRRAAESSLDRLAGFLRETPGASGDDPGSRDAGGAASGDASRP